MAELVDVPVCAECGQTNCHHGRPSELMVRMPAARQIAMLEEALRRLEQRVRELQRSESKAVDRTDRQAR